MLNRRLRRLVLVYTCQNATLLEITCRGSFLIQEMLELKHDQNFLLKGIHLDNVELCLI